MNSVRIFRPGLDITLEIPSCWNDCDSSELNFICAQLLKFNESKSIFYADVLLFTVSNRAQKKGISLPDHFFRSLNWEDLFQQNDVAFDWIHQQTSLTVQPIPRLTIGRFIPRFTYGPSDDFNDLKTGEFEDCEVFHLLFGKENDFEHLAMLAAILYRPKAGGSRVPYQDYQPERVKPLFKKLPQHQLLLIHTWYCGCRANLPKYFPNVFDSKTTSKNIDLSAFTKCIHAGAGARNGTRPQIRDTILKEFLLDMDLQAKAAAEMEAELNRKR